MFTLGLDTTGPYCSVSIVDPAHCCAHISKPMQRGHAEALAPMVADALAQAQLGAADIGRVAPDNADSEECSQEPPLAEGEEVAPSAAPIDKRCNHLPSEEDLDMFTRMAVSSTKVVLFQLAQEAGVEGAKDVFDLYEGLLTTSALSRAAAEGFPAMNVDSLMSPRHSCYRRLVAARHRFLVSYLCCSGIRIHVDD